MRILRELLVQALEQKVPVVTEPAAILRVGTTDGRSAARLAAAMTRDALQHLVAQLTVDELEAALHSVPVEAAARAIIDPTRRCSN